jgi:hypothetical protein
MANEKIKINSDFPEFYKKLTNGDLEELKIKNKHKYDGWKLGAVALLYVLLIMALSAGLWVAAVQLNIQTDRLFKSIESTTFEPAIKTNLLTLVTQSHQANFHMIFVLYFSTTIGTIITGLTQVMKVFNGEQK